MSDGRKRDHTKMRDSVLRGKNCLITGATGGLGKELCRQLIQKECNLFLTSRNERDLKILQKDLCQINKKLDVFFYKADLRNSKEIAKLVVVVKSKMKSVDVLINCAGVFHHDHIQKSAVEDFDESINVNVKAPFILSKSFVNDMIKREWGRIVNICSSSSHTGFANSSIYCSSKHALLGLSRALYEELRTKHIRVYSFSPGSIKTKMGKKIKNQNYESFMSAEEVSKFIVFSISFDSELITNEVKMSRINPT